MKNILRKLDLEDLGQIMIGSTMLSIPIAFTEETGEISEVIKLSVINDIITSIKRIILVAFPASMGAVIIDSLDKE